MCRAADVMTIRVRLPVPVAVLIVLLLVPRTAIFAHCSGTKSPKRDIDGADRFRTQDITGGGGEPHPNMRAYRIERRLTPQDEGDVGVAYLMFHWHSPIK